MRRINFLFKVRDLFPQRLQDVKGTLVLDVKLENTLKKPEPRGVIRIFDGALAIPEYGTKYDQFRLVMAIDPGLVNLTYLNVLSPEGSLDAKGKLHLRRGEFREIEDGKIDPMAVIQELREMWPHVRDLHLTDPAYANWLRRGYNWAWYGKIYDNGPRSNSQ